MMKAAMKVDTWLSALDRLEYAAVKGDGMAILTAIDSLAYSSLQHMLCTVNRFDEEKMRVVRIYSSNPDAYPVGGIKEKRNTRFGQHVLIERRAFVGEGSRAISEMFEDYETILRLGVRSIINVPVVIHARCLGTLNFSMRDESVSPGKLGVARLAALYTAMAFALLDSHGVD